MYQQHSELQRRQQLATEAPHEYPPVHCRLYKCKSAKAAHSSNSATGEQPKQVAPRQRGEKAAECGVLSPQCKYNTIQLVDARDNRKCRTISRTMLQASITKFNRHSFYLSTTSMTKLLSLALLIDYIDYKALIGTLSIVSALV